MKKIVIIGGGTISYVRNHLALCAPAYGHTADRIFTYLSPNAKLVMEEQFHCNDKSVLLEKAVYRVQKYKTKMASGKYLSDAISTLETNDDVETLIDKLIADPDVKTIFFNVALVDFNGRIDEVESGKYAERLETSKGEYTLKLTPTDKIIGKIRKERKDIFVVGFKTTTNASSDIQYKKGLELLKKNSLNLVLANDTITRNNIIIAPEETRYYEGIDRDKAIFELVQMTLSRMNNTFTRSTVVDGKPIDWNSDEVPDNLRTVVNHCIKNGAYKPVLGKTAGHFAVKVNDGEILTSIRKTNFNDLENVGLVRVEYDGKDKVIAHGAKPSVGGMSQRIIFTEHSDAECIVHFHCKPKKNIETLAWSERVPSDHVMNNGEISIKPQINFQCGSHGCGQNTSNGLAKIDLGDGDYLKAVYLDSHGPNIVFSKNTPSEKVIAYIDRTFDLSSKTGGLI